MKKTTLPGVVLLSALVVACSDTPLALDEAELTHATVLAAQQGPVVAHVSVGSNDLCDALGLAPGCDANFSLVANRWADGSVRGQWHDQFGRDGDGRPLGGIHASIDCLEVVDIQVGIYSFTVAWVSGVVTRSTSSDFAVGDGVITGAVDRGTSANDLFEDLGTFSFPLSVFPAGTSCTDRPDLPVFLNTDFVGQIDIWSR